MVARNVWSQARLCVGGLATKTTSVAKMETSRLAGWSGGSWWQSCGGETACEHGCGRGGRDGEAVWPARSHTRFCQSTSHELLILAAPKTQHIGNAQNCFRDGFAAF